MTIETSTVNTVVAICAPLAVGLQVWIVKTLLVVKFRLEELSTKCPHCRKTAELRANL